jgi:hypothetical protein
MSKRTDLIQDLMETMNAGTAIRAWIDANATEDCMLYAPAVTDGDVRGRAAMTEALEQFVAQAHPRYRLDSDLVEHGNFIVAFLVVESGTASANACQMFRFEGEKLSGAWGVRG